MYKRLTKIVVINNQECVACALHGTHECRIFKGIANCLRCDMFAAILNQLHEFENIICDVNTEAQKENVN